ncbi:MAG: M67 family metallopeptidase, partial [Cyanobacteria bacterium P01_A01_bin.17]
QAAAGQSAEGQSAETKQKQLIELVPLNNEWAPDILTAHRPVSAAPASASTASTSQGVEVGLEDSHTKQRRYWIDPKDMLRVQRQAREKGLNIIGIYHSHPDHVAEPSECDRALAWPAYAYVIVSVCEGKAVDVQNWALDSKHQFQPEAMEISGDLSGITVLSNSLTQLSYCRQ